MTLAIHLLPTSFDMASATLPGAAVDDAVWAGGGAAACTTAVEARSPAQT
jgi:hypothetical protein